MSEQQQPKKERKNAPLIKTTVVLLILHGRNHLAPILTGASGYEQLDSVPNPWRSNSLAEFVTLRTTRARNADESGLVDSYYRFGIIIEGY